MYSERLLTLIPSKYHKRIVVHDHFYLQEEFGLMGVHLSERNPNEPHDFSGHLTTSCTSLEELRSKKRYYDYTILYPVFDGISPSASVAGHDEYNPYADKVPNKPMTGPAIKSEGTPIPSFKSMMEAREASGRPFDCSADEDMLRGVKMGQVYKSENGTFMVINSSRPNVASSLGIQAKIEPQDLHKSFAPKFEEKEEDPLRKSLKNDWDNYMAYKETDSF